MNCPNDTHEIRQFVKHHQAHDDCTCEQLKQWVLELCDRLDGKSLEMVVLRNTIEMLEEEVESLQDEMHGLHNTIRDVG